MLNIKQYIRIQIYNKCKVEYNFAFALLKFTFSSSIKCLNQKISYLFLKYIYQHYFSTLLRRKCRYKYIEFNLSAMYQRHFY